MIKFPRLKAASIITDITEDITNGNGGKIGNASIALGSAAEMYTLPPGTNFTRDTSTLTAAHAAGGTASQAQTARVGRPAGVGRQPGPRRHGREFDRAPRRRVRDRRRRHPGRRDRRGGDVSPVATPAWPATSPTRTSRQCSTRNGATRATRTSTTRARPRAGTSRTGPTSSASRPGRHRPRRLRRARWRLAAADEGRRPAEYSASRSDCTPATGP